MAVSELRACYPVILIQTILYTASFLLLHYIGPKKEIKKNNKKGFKYIVFHSNKTFYLSSSFFSANRTHKTLHFNKSIKPAIENKHLYSAICTGKNKVKQFKIHLKKQNKKKCTRIETNEEKNEKYVLITMPFIQNKIIYLYTTFRSH